MIDVNLGLIVLVLFFVLVLLRVPVFIALAAPSITYFVLMGFPMSFVSGRMMRVVNSFTLLAVPTYIFLGALLNHSKIADYIFDFASDLVGHMTGGLAQVNILTSLIFSGMSGSALADIGGVGRVLIDQMKESGYSRGYSAALTSTSATIGPIFPPSIPLIIFGLLAQVSILSLFLAGILPALFAVVVLIVTTALLTKFRNFPAARDRPAARKLLRSAYVALPAIFAPVLLVTGLLTGLFSTIEAAVVTIAYMLVTNIIFYRNFNLDYIWKAAKETVLMSATIIIIIAAAGLFSRVMTLEGIDTLFASFLFGVSSNPIVIIVLVNLFLLVLGLFLEPVAAMVMAIPIVLPPLVEIGLDPVHIGIIMVFNLMIGLLTPPLGLSLFFASDISDAPLSEILLEMKYYYVALIFILLAISFLPWLSLYIPQEIAG